MCKGNIFFAQSKDVCAKSFLFRNELPIVGIKGGGICDKVIRNALILQGEF